MVELEPQFLEVVSTSAQELRSAYTPLQPGVMDAGDLKITAGAGTREVIGAAGTGFVRGSNVTDQGLYRCRNNAPMSSNIFSLGGIPANASGFNRIDQIIARLLDHSHDSSGLRRWRFEVVPGVGASGATLDNRTGAVADGSIGNNWLRLADVLVPTGATTILAANIRDRRPWARGAYSRIMRNSGDYTTASMTLVEIDATNLAIRLECSGVPLRIRLNGSVSAGGSVTTAVFVPLIDGASVDGMNIVGGVTGSGGYRNTLHAANYSLSGPIDHTTVPTPGSHRISLAWGQDTGPSIILRANATGPAVFIVEEILRQNANNN